MSFEELQEGEKVLWEAVDQAFFGPDATRGERATTFAAVIDRATERGELGKNRREKSLGTRLKELRRERQLTPTQAAGKAGVQAGCWRHWEANLAIPGGEELARASQVVGQDSLGELWRLRRRAPRFHLERMLRPRSLARVARTAGVEGGDEAELDRLEVRNLDAAVRQGLVQWLGENATEERLAEVIRETRELPESAQERWLQAVAERVELD